MSKLKAFGRIITLPTVFGTLAVILFFSLAKTRAVVHAHAQDETTATATTGCTLATIAANYGMVTFASNADGGASSFIGILAPNGKGSVTLRGANPVETQAFAGTYALDSNCSGTMRIKDTQGVENALDILVVSNGSQIYLMNTTPGIVATYVATKIH
jgi:hypothetical protein